MSPKVILGLSGGVDSAVAALLLKEQGYNVEAVFMKNWEDDNYPNDECPVAQDFQDAEAICDKLQITLHVANFSREYKERVFQYMLDEYLKGRTPNPDVMCNKEIKFKEFISYAKKLNADFIATGHYARHIVNETTNNKQHKLYKAIDHNKDQTYFLYNITQKQLAFTLFPLGELIKTEVRNLAKKAGFSNYAKKDSTGICFIGERKFKNFLSEYLLTKPGEIVSVEGKIIGKHDGLMFYTLGQRQGLGIGGQKGMKEAPWYVVKKDLKQNKLIVSQDTAHPLLMSKTLICSDIHWIAEKEPCFPLQCSAKTRYRQNDQGCIITQNMKDQYLVTFNKAQRAITPGQAVVFYSQEECLGGGTIL